MGKLDIKQSMEVKTNASKTWDVVGPNFLNISDWGRGIHNSWKNETADAKYRDAPAGGRYCDVAGFGTFDERIIHFDALERQISWSATGEKLPNFLSGLQNALTIEEIDDNTCRISSNITANLSGVMGSLLGFPLKKNFSKTLKGFLNDWKTYAETGQVSETKQRELAKIGKQK